MQSHYAGIVVGYAVATLVVWLLWFTARPVVAAAAAPTFRRPWVSLALVLAGVAATIAIGQAWVRGWLLPESSVALQSLNQLIIFAPIVVAAVSHPQRLASGGLPLGAPIVGLAIGAALAVAAVAAYAFVRNLPIAVLFPFVLSSPNIDIAVQVLLEDIAIAALLLRLNAILGAKWTVTLVAALFALAHVPAMLAGGETLAAGLPSLVITTAIGLMVMGAVLATRSVWWAWPVHTCMDITQFYPS